MTLQQQLEAELNQLTSLGSGKLTVNHDSGTLECVLSRVDALGVAFHSFVYITNKLAQAETAKLSKIADQLATKLTYLLEPLRVIEIDSHAGAVQMRSAPPYKQENQVTYYEVLVQRGGSISLVRYQKLPAEARTAIEAVLTREVFCRLAQDCDEAAK